VAAGAKERVLVPFAEAYGPRDPEQMQRVRRTDLPVEGELSIGDQFQTGPHRSDPVVTIAAIEGEEVLLDANHPLAGVDLTFDVELTEVRDATPEEVAQGGPAAKEGCGEGCGCAH
jgi:FKBP-type peptidyl-prolyl cis-trans isomerase SlyD